MAINRSNCADPIYQGLIFTNGNLTIFPAGNTINLSSLSYTDNKMTYLTDVSLSNNLLSITYVGENDVPQTKNVFLPYGDLEAISYTGIAPIFINDDNEIFIVQASTSVSGYLTSTDWNIFNNKIGTADNGLTKTGVNVQLGGTLLIDTTIDQDTNDFIMTGGDIFFESLPEVTTDDVVYYNSTTGLLTYGPAGGGGGDSLRFGVATEDDTAAEDRLFDLGAPNTFRIFTGVTDEILEFKQAAFNVSVTDAIDPNMIAHIEATSDGATEATTISTIHGDGHLVGMAAVSSASQSMLAFELGDDPIWTVVGLPTDTADDILYYDSATGEVTWGAATSSGNTYTSDNAITLTGTNFQLGGELIQDTTITSNDDDFHLNLEGVTNAIKPALFNITTTGDGFGVVVQALSGTAGVQSFVGDGIGIWGLATTGIGVLGESDSGTGVHGTSTSGFGGEFLVQPTSTNTIVPVINVQRNTSATAANGIGGSIDFYLDSTTGNTLSSRIISKYTDATNATRTGQLEFWNTNNAVSARKAAIAGNGQLTLDNYGGGVFTGTLTKYLAVTSAGAVIETDAATQSITLTADNGLNKNTSTNVRLGGALVIPLTTIDHTGGDYRIEFLGDAGNFNPMLYVHGGPQGIDVEGTSIGIKGTSPVIPIWAINNAAGNTLHNAIVLQSLPSAAGGVGLGTGIQFDSKNSSGGITSVGQMGYVMTDATAGAVDTDLHIYTKLNNTLVKYVTVYSNGDVELHAVGGALIMASPDTTRYKATMANGGAWSIAAA